MTGKVAESNSDSILSVNMKVWRPKNDNIKNL